MKRFIFFSLLFTFIISFSAAQTTSGVFFGEEEQDSPTAVNGSAANSFFPAPPAKLVGTVPATDSNGLYRIQVGAFSIPKNAVDAFDKLIKAGLNPNFVENGEYINVVLAGIKAEDIAQIAQSLGNAGFPEVLVRAEN